MAQKWKIKNSPFLPMGIASWPKMLLLIDLSLKCFHIMKKILTFKCIFNCVRNIWKPALIFKICNITNNVSPFFPTPLRILTPLLLNLCVDFWMYFYVTTFTLCKFPFFFLRYHNTVYFSLSWIFLLKYNLKIFLIDKCSELNRYILDFYLFLYHCM